MNDQPMNDEKVPESLKPPKMTLGDVAFFVGMLSLLLLLDVAIAFFIATLLSFLFQLPLLLTTIVLSIIIPIVFSVVIGLMDKNYNDSEYY